MTEFISEGCTNEGVGAGGLLFLPMLSGGTPLEGGARVRGTIHGLDLSHRREHIIRAALEGIATSLRRGLDIIGQFATTNTELLIAGGGSRHPGWNQIYADILGVPLISTAVDQQAAALGAATIAFVGTGVWQTFKEAERPHVPRDRYQPNPNTAEQYEAVRARFNRAVALMAEFKRPLA